MKKVDRLHPAHEVDMDGLKVFQPIPTANTEQVDPFILIHHHDNILQGGLHPRETGVGPHPHRGFSPVTFIFEGALHHRDSRGNNSIIHSGGIQWMEAGMGITHSERLPVDFAESGGKQELVQVWINLPKALKKSQPNYFAFQKENLPYISFNKTQLYITSGSINDVLGAIQPSYPISSAMGFGVGNDMVTLKLNEGDKTLIYILNGNVFLKGFGLVEEKNLIEFSTNGNEVHIKFLSDCQYLVLSGQPIEEPIAIYGPYVMNSQSEILEAIRDFQMGKMGILIEEY